MTKFIEQKFNIGELKGISAKNVEEHLKLYSGYVNNVNGNIEKMSKLSEGMFRNGEDNGYLLAELFRRFSFEYNGMRNHEVYFSSLSGTATPISEGPLKEAIGKSFGPFDNFLSNFKALAMTRGIGWATLWYDKKDNILLTSWIDEQHLGQLNGCEMILTIDMWEHAFIYDYSTSEKKKYVEAFFENLNWKVIEENFEKAL
jgi:Fe-Mn family superoxide dismutase